MNPREAVLLTRYVRALCPQQKFDEYTPDAWYDALRHLDLDTCQQACATISRRQPFIAPAEIIDEVRGMRRARLENFAYTPPAGDSDPNYLARLRGQINAVASGRVPATSNAPMLEGGPHPMVVRALESVGQHVPINDTAPDVASVRRAGPLGIECPTCKALIGRPCRTPSGKNRPTHPARKTPANTAEAQRAQAEMERRQAASRAALAALPPGTAIEPQDGFTATRSA